MISFQVFNLNLCSVHQDGRGRDEEAPSEVRRHRAVRAAGWTAIANHSHASDVSLVPVISGKSPIKLLILQQRSPQQISFVPEESRKALGMEEVPMRVVINPRLTVTDSNEVSARESCCSVQGMSAIVPRAEAVRVYTL